MKQQKELFDGFVRLRNCLRCKRKLHSDPNGLYQTREAGLCYACLKAFEASPYWSVCRFIEMEKEAEQRAAIAEFYEAEDQFNDLF